MEMPETENASVDLMVKRQVIKTCPEAWRQGLNEAGPTDMDPLCDKIFLLQKVSKGVTNSEPFRQRQGSGSGECREVDFLCNLCTQFFFRWVEVEQAE